MKFLIVYNLVADNTPWVVELCESLKAATEHVMKFEFEIDRFRVFEVPDNFKPNQKLNPDLKGLTQVQLNADGSAYDPIEELVKQANKRQALLDQIEKAQTAADARLSALEAE